MKHPGFMSTLFGNAVSFFALSVGLLVFGGLFLTGQGSFFPALLFLIGACYAYKANERLRAYKAWQREWDAMATPPSRRR